MTPQRKRGGKQILDYLYSDIDYADQYAAAQDFAAVSRILQNMRQRVRDDVEPMFMRAEPSMDAKIKEMDARVKELEQWRERIEAGNVTKFRKVE